MLIYISKSTSIALVPALTYGYSDVVRGITICTNSIKYSAAYPDPTAFDPQDKHYDPKSDPDNPRWFLVDVKYVEKLKRNIPLSELREYQTNELEGLQLLKKGNRLSIMPVSREHFEFILGLV